ncbi:MAG: hypothetical protein ACJ8NS_07360 [Chthoniobacterales bacterium]
MPLHPVKLPSLAARLFRVVALQKVLLKALANPALNVNAVNRAWVQNLWKSMDPGWVTKFCRRGQLARIQTIAAAAPAFRQALYAEFCRQNKIETLIGTGGNFVDVATLPSSTAALALTVKKFFVECYELLGSSSRVGGYYFAGRSITKRTYREKFCEAYPTIVICPYCDGDIGNPDLDHYLAKTLFPLIACSPWNLVPICKSCNDVVTGKGGGAAITLGPPRSTNDWLHPFFRPASKQVWIRLNGPPQGSIPRLHSPNAAEATRLDNHMALIDQTWKANPCRSLTKRWTNKAAAYFDVLVRQVNKNAAAQNPRVLLVWKRFNDHYQARGRTASSMIHLAVCEAVLVGRAGYVWEFVDSNPPQMV